LTAVLDAAPARVLLLLVGALAAALLPAVVSGVLLLLTGLLLSTMLLAALATLLMLLATLLILLLAHAVAPLQRSLGRDYLRYSRTLLLTKCFVFWNHLRNI
jgi:cobalamin biosynthesis protein CobD/CbiB